MLQNATPQCPDLLPVTSLMNVSLVPRLPREMHLCGSSSNAPRLPSFLEMLQNPHVLLTFDKVHNPLRLPREMTSERPKVVRTRRYFKHFHLAACFAPQRRALFQHLSFQKCSKPGVLCTFWLGNVLRATTAEPQIIGKTQCFATFLPFSAPGSSFFWDFLFFDIRSSSLLFSSLFFSSLLFSSLTLPTSAFPSVHIVRSLASKLPSTTPRRKPSRTVHYFGVVKVGCDPNLNQDATI